MVANQTGVADSESSSSVLRQRRPSTAAETIIDTVKEVEAKVEKALLVLWDDLPHWRRDNHFITTGYRAPSNSYRKSFASVFYVHNESVNIWTHLLGAVFFLVAGTWMYGAIAPRYASASNSDVLAFSCFFAGAVLCLGMSATYHTICDHSQQVSRWGNKLDYTGIVFCITGSNVSALYYGLFCHPALLRIYLTGLLILGFGCGVASWVERFRTPQWRPYRAAMFVCFGLSSVVPVCHGVQLHGYADLVDRLGLNWILLEGFLYVFGAFLYAARWPERTSKGTFDIWGSSHQIFHVLVLLAAASHLTGIIKAFDYHHSVMGAHC